MMKRTEHPLYTAVAGPVATVRVCKFCNHSETVRRSPGSGRGYGLRAGNQALGRLMQHIKAAHPTEYAAYLAKERERKAKNRAAFEQRIADLHRK